MSNDYESGVVLVQTVEYYEIRMANGGVLYFTGSDFDKNTGEFIGLTTELDTLIPDIIYGTGFFISKNGKIATNKHVVEGNISEKEARMGLGKIIHALEDALLESKDQYTQCLNDAYALKDGLKNKVTNDTLPGTSQAYNDAIKLFIERLEIVNQLLRQLRYNDPSQMDLRYHNDVRIAYNNTFIHKINDLKPCTVRLKSDTDDLAIIQLNTKETPERRHVFELTPKDMIQHYSFGEFLMHLIGQDKNKNLMMIGYNAGLGMAITEEGIMAQHTRGSIVQYIESSREFLYDIPALEGSSGSPVINKRGQVVGVNYAKASTGVSNFDFGVKEKYLYNLNKKLVE